MSSRHYLLLFGVLFSLLVFTVPHAEASRCIYNNAYQENYEVDSLKTILADAVGCYVLVDPYELENPIKQIALIKKQKNEVGCYISVGTGEVWRSDYASLKPSLVKKEWSDWEGEYFIKKIESNVTEVMTARIAQLKSWGCDWVEFDNMDWSSDTAQAKAYDIKATETETIAYVKTLCRTVRALGMKCMAKSTTYALDDFDGMTVESYPKEKNWWEKSELANTLKKSGLGIVIHYNESRCSKTKSWYKSRYGDSLSFLCEDKKQKNYIH
jgi:endo-alpha-1,4-polygalactosaminidase (GH114 family)